MNFLKKYRNLFLIIITVGLAIWINLPNNPGIHIGNINKEIATRQGLDLVGGVQALLEADLPTDTQIDAEKMRTAVTIVENRVNGLGLNEAVVQQAGDRRIVVELPGEEDPDQALATIKQTGLLEFVDMGSNPLPDGTKVVTDFSTGKGAEDQNQLTPASITPTVEPTALAIETPSTEGEILHTVMTGEVIETVQVTRDRTGKYVIEFKLTPEGTKVFGEYTSTHVGQFLGIVLDKQVISAPEVREPITEGQGVIEGAFTLESANALAIQLRYGSLPIPLKVVETRTIGPSLGQDSLQRSVIALSIGFVIVMLFMALYYRLPGVLADVAIIIYALIAFAIFRFIPVTLTLPGIAGFMLSTGSALDANILIFERLKEELRSGKNLRQAFDLSIKRAWPSIRDSNIATLITCGILFWFGSNYGATIVKGFSITLALGVFVSLFTALVVTRTFLSITLDNLRLSNIVRWFGL